MRLAIVGTGYVGLVSGTCMAEMGNDVMCVDNHPGKLAKLRNREIPIYEPGLEMLFHRNIQAGRLEFTDDLEAAVLVSDLVFLCLPTPMGEDGSADLTHVLAVAGDIGRILARHPGHGFKIIVNKSTVPVGTADRVRAALTQAGADPAGVDVVSNPEFLKEGYAVEDFMKPDRIVIGTDNPESREAMERLYQPFVRQGNPMLFMDTASAEVTKYAANAYLATRITYMNELANFCEAVGADVDLVRRGMGTDQRIGKRFLFAGIGYGGSCFPKDVHALIKTARDADSPLAVLGMVDEANQRQKRVLVAKIKRHYGDDLRGRRFAVWGLAFKPNTDDMREAPSLTLIDDLLAAGASVCAFDPAAMGAARQILGDRVEYAESDYDALTGADALCILTEWNEFRNPEFERIRSELKSPVVFDGRNIYAPGDMAELGFTYYSIGRRAVRPA